ncbi:MAG: tetratricopeptide repeat protein [bacterium]
MTRVSKPLKFNDGTLIRNIEQFKGAFAKYQHEVFKRLIYGDLEKFFYGIYEDDYKNIILSGKSQNKSSEEIIKEIADKLEVQLTSSIKSEDFISCDTDIKEYLEGSNAAINLTLGEWKSDKDILITSCKSVFGEPGRTLISISNISIDLPENETIEFSNLIFKGLNSKNTIVISKGNLSFKNIIFENVTIIASGESSLSFEKCKIYSSKEGIVISDGYVKYNYDDINKNVSFEKVGTEIKTNDFDFEKVKELIDSKQYSEALTYCDKAIEFNPNIADYWNDKGDALRKLSRDDEAIECYDKAIELKPDNADYWNYKGDFLYNLHQHKEAVECYDKAIGLRPDNADYWNHKGDVLQKLSRFDEAGECYDKAIELEPDNAAYWSHKGDALRKLSRDDEAIECYDKAIGLKSDDDAAYWINKGFRLYCLNKFSEAIKCYDKAIELKPDNADYWNYKGDFLYNLHQHKEAVECYDKAIGLKSDDDAAYWINKGYASPKNQQLVKPKVEQFFNFGNFGMIKGVDQFSTNDSDYWRNKGNELLRQNKREEAQECYGRANKIKYNK